LSEGRKTVGQDAAPRSSKTDRSGRNWRAEVEPTLRSVRQRPIGVPHSQGFSFERLVFAEVGDGHSERVDGDEFVRNLRLEHENEIRGI
jgi:hypothetical protein